MASVLKENFHVLENILIMVVIASVEILKFLVGQMSQDDLVKKIWLVLRFRSAISISLQLKLSFECHLVLAFNLSSTVVIYQVLETDVFISPKKLINCRWKSQSIGLLVMKSNIESVRDDRSTICKHIIEKVMILFLLSLVKL